MRFDALWRLSPTPLFLNSRGVGGWGLVARRWCKGIHARVSSGESGGGGYLMGSMLRRGESSWLCMKFEFAFIAGPRQYDEGSSVFISCVDCE
jgi:hypothetical protein